VTFLAEWAEVLVNEQALELCERKTWTRRMAGRAREVAIRNALAAAKAHHASAFMEPLEIVGAPVLGRDAAADAYISDHWEEYKDGGYATPADFVAAHAGQAVVELAREPGGVPAVPGSAGPLDFGAEALRELGGVLSADLIERCEHNHTPIGMLALAVALADAAKTVAQIGTHRAILDGAVRWLRFWAKRGFYLHAWY
jgi:hypothetical protein